MGAIALSEIPYDEHATAIFVNYGNKNYIADKVLPETPVGKLNYTYLKSDRRRAYEVLSKPVGATGSVPYVTTGAKRMPGLCQDYGLRDLIVRSDYEDARESERQKLIDRKVLALAEDIRLGREARVAALFANSASYDSQLQETPTSTDKWDKDDVDPIEQILEAMDKPLMSPNIAVMSKKIWNILRKHPKVIETVYGKASTRGLVLREDFVSALELSAIYTGEARAVNSRKTDKNDVSDLITLWGDNFTLAYIPPVVTAENSNTFGFTAVYGKVASSREVAGGDAGLRGGVEVMAGEGCDEKIVEPAFAYFFKDVLSN